MFDLFLEIKPSYAIFQTYKPGGTTVKVHLVDLGDQFVHPCVNVRAQLSNSVEEFKGWIKWCELGGGIGFKDRLTIWLRDW